MNSAPAGDAQQERSDTAMGIDWEEILGAEGEDLADAWQESVNEAEAEDEEDEWCDPVEDADELPPIEEEEEDAPEPPAQKLLQRPAAPLPFDPEQDLPIE